MTVLVQVAFANATDAIANILVHLARSERYGGQSIGSIVPLVELAVRTNSLVCVGRQDRLLGVACWVPGSKAAQLESYRTGRFRYDENHREQADAAFMTIIHAADRAALRKLVQALKLANVGREVIWNRHNGAIRSLEPGSSRYVAQL